MSPAAEEEYVQHCQEHGCEGGNTATIASLGRRKGWPAGDHGVTTGVARLRAQRRPPSYSPSEPANDSDHAGKQHGDEHSRQKLLEKKTCCATTA